MNSKTISTYVSAGYTLKARFSELDITATGGVGGTGVFSDHLAKIVNAGTINETTGVTAIVIGNTALGGSVVNQASGFINGYFGVVLGALGSVANYGTIEATIDPIALNYGGAITNGTYLNQTALIAGTAVYVQGAAGAVTNFGTIKAEVRMTAGGVVTNGGYTDLKARIEGYSGVVIDGLATVTNLGVIDGVGYAAGAAGVVLNGGGSLSNGGHYDAAARIEGYNSGVILHGAATMTNFGTISASAVDTGVGVYIDAGAITNGASGETNAVIQGERGVVVLGTATVTNFGTILGEPFRGAALQFSSSTDVLVVEAGCAFVGAVLGAGGALDLDTGVGTLTGLLAGGNVTVSGSMATTTFQDFATVEIGAAAQFTASGAVTIAAGQSLIDAGSLTLGGSMKASIVNAGVIKATASATLVVKYALANAGTLSVVGGALTVNGSVTGAGQATIDGGTLAFASAFKQNVTFTGTIGTLELGKSQGYTVTVTGFSKTGGTLLDLADIAFVSAGEATYSGGRKGGVLTVTDGTHTATITLKGDYRNSTFVASSDGHGGTIIHDPASLPASLPFWGAPGSGQRFVAAMAGLGSSGGSTVHADEPWVGGGAMLSKPRAMIA